MGARKRRGVRHGSSGAQPCAGCPSANLWALNRLTALSSAVSLPAFQEPRREIPGSGRSPSIHDRRSDKSTVLDFTAVGPNLAAQLSSIKPDKLLAGLRRAGNLEELFKWNTYAQLFV